MVGDPVEVARLLAAILRSVPGGGPIALSDPTAARFVHACLPPWLPLPHCCHLFVRDPGPCLSCTCACVALVEGPPLLLSTSRVPVPVPNSPGHKKTLIWESFLTSYHNRHIPAHPSFLVLPPPLGGHPCLKTILPLHMPLQPLRFIPAS